MTRRSALLAGGGYVAGIASALAYVALAGGWYEYHDFYPTSESEIARLINEEGWEHISTARTPAYEYLRRPRFRLPAARVGGARSPTP